MFILFLFKAISFSVSYHYYNIKIYKITYATLLNFSHPISFSIKLSKSDDP